MSRAAVLLAASLAATGLPTDPNLTPMYAVIRSQLQSSVVPVLLPASLPAAFGRVRSVTLMSAGRDGYYVGFSAVANCAGALSCAFFHVAGYPATTHSDRSYRRDQPVQLPGSIRGFFRPEDCSGASCTEAQLVFERGGAVYELDAKVGRENRRALEGAYRALRLTR